MTNARLPHWHTVSTSIFRTLFAVLYPLKSFDVPQSTISESVNQLADECADQLTQQSKDVDHRVQLDPLTTAAKALRDCGLRAGVYDKANHCPWVTCSTLSASVWVECFLTDPRKHEVFRVETQGVAYPPPLLASFA